MPIVFALLSTLSIALGEFLANGVSSRARSHEVTSAMFLSGACATGLVALVWRGDPTWNDIGVGLLAGVANGVGILLLYRSYATASLRSAAPAAAVVMSSVPIGWDIAVNGSSLTALTGLGLALGVIAIALTSYEGGVASRDRKGLNLAILAGAVFGTLLVLLSYIGRDAGGTPLLVQRVVAFAVAAGVTRLTGPRIVPSNRRDRWTSLLIGLLATAAIVLFLLALRDGDLAVVSVLSSQYAGVAVVLGVIFHSHKMYWWQWIGLAAASLAVALISVG
ncbi:MAG: EamA family transporter [Actinomycetia bacterium]|nr:EamA family transporter [Actinomycetes bacterium]MCP4962853.1 EamA family transporter [Actinomycetes bacterium]